VCDKRYRKTEKSKVVMRMRKVGTGWSCKELRANYYGYLSIRYVVLFR
jgi:hypothetical protein